MAIMADLLEWGNEELFSINVELASLRAGLSESAGGEDGEIKGWGGGDEEASLGFVGIVPIVLDSADKVLFVVIIALVFDKTGFFIEVEVVPVVMSIDGTALGFTDEDMFKARRSERWMTTSVSAEPELEKVVIELFFFVLVVNLWKQ